MIVKAYAKINWHLKVLGRRANGYHNLDMVMQRIDLYDELEISPADRLRLTAGGLPVDTGYSNLILRAARTLQEATGTSKGAHIHLSKRIPLGAGLGGGSADAAAALQGLNDLWETRCDKALLHELGLRIGADVPYCLEIAPARVGGLGEKIEVLCPFAPTWLVLMKPTLGLNTKAVFARYDQEPLASEQGDTGGVVQALTEGRLDQLQRCAFNDLRLPAIRLLPEIQSMLSLLVSTGADFAQMTGSGSAVFGAFAQEEKAQRAYQTLSEAGLGDVWLCQGL